MRYSLSSGCPTDLHSKLPQGTNGDARDWAIVVGRDDGALFRSANTGHSLDKVEDKRRVICVILGSLITEC